MVGGLAWTRDAADGQQRLLILDGHRTHYSIDFVRYAVKNGITLLSYPGHTTHLLQPLMSAYLHPSKKHMARQCITTLTKPEPASPRSSSLAFIHRQSDKRIPKRTSKQPGAQLAYTLSAPMPSYNHFFESWGRNKAMENMSGALRSTPPRSSWPGRHRKIAANSATSRTLQFTSSLGLAWSRTA